MGWCLLLVLYCHSDTKQLLSSILAIVLRHGAAISRAAQIHVLHLCCCLFSSTRLRYGSAAKGKWYKAQSERNKGLLAQLPISETEGFDGASDPQQPLMAAQPATAGGAVDSHQQQHRRSSGSVTATWTATGPTGSITEGLTQRRLPGVAQHNGNGSVLGSLSSPAYSATTQSAPGGDGGHGDEGQRGSLAPASASAAVHGRLVSKSWAPGARAGSGGGGTVTFNSNPLAR